jgi:hypothetical protein
VWLNTYTESVFPPYAQGLEAVAPQQNRTGTSHRLFVGHLTGTMRQSEPKRLHTTMALLRPVVGPLGISVPPVKGVEEDQCAWTTWR